MLLMSPVCTLKTQTDVATRLKNGLAGTIKADITLGALPDDDRDYVDDDNDDDDDDDDYVYVNGNNDIDGCGGGHGGDLNTMMS